MFCLIVDREPAKKVVIFTSVISLLHAVVNPPLYAWMSQRYRQGYLFVFKMALSVCGGTRPNRRSLSKGLFTWREGAPANRATRGGLTSHTFLSKTHRSVYLLDRVARLPGAPCLLARGTRLGRVAFCPNGSSRVISANRR